MKNLFFLLLITCLLACDNDSSQMMEPETAFEELAEIPVTQSAPVYTDRKLIKTGELAFETEHLTKTNAKLKQLTAHHGGYISKEMSEQFDKKNWQRITIKVPTAQFEQLLSAATKGIKKFDVKEISTQDVTEEYRDLEARIATKKKVEQRFLEILKTAKSVKEILLVETEAGKVREEIERAEGRLKYLTHQTSMSTLSVAFYEVIPIIKPQEETFLYQLREAFASGFALLQSILITLVNLWPIVILTGAGLLAYRYWSKKSDTVNS